VIVVWGVDAILCAICDPVSIDTGTVVWDPLVVVGLGRICCKVVLCPGSEGSPEEDGMSKEGREDGSGLSL
jgi:hypothetical protein